MNMEDRVKALEEELQVTKDELRQILLDIRACLMETQTPLPANLNRGEFTGQSDSGKGVKSDGS